MLARSVAVIINHTKKSLPVQPIILLLFRLEGDILSVNPAAMALLLNRQLNVKACRGYIHVDPKQSIIITFLQCDI